MQLFQKQFLDKASHMAEQASHVFPQMAAAEAALESRYGTSGLAIQDNNLFGMKLHSHNIYGVHILPTKEFLNGEWVTVNAQWEKYPSQAECFKDRMSTLQRLSSVYPHYKAALEATDEVTYVTQVSVTWSTDPQRAQKVLSIYKEYVSGPSSN